MFTVDYSAINDNLNSYCNKVSENNEAVIVTRKGEKNVVLISFEEYNLLKKTFSEFEKLFNIKEELLAAEKDRCSGIPGCTVSELDCYLDKIIAEA